MKLFFQKIGEGKPLIILHGLYGFSDNWMTIARQLTKNFTIYLVDQRNHGKSPHHPELNYTVMSEDLHELLLSENLDNVILLGHSMGGKTAMLFAATYPQMVSALIVADIGPGGYASLESPSSQVLVHLNIINTLKSIDLNVYSSRVEVERELAKSIADIGVRQFIMKNIHRNHDGSFSWKLNVDAISKALPSIMGPAPIDKVLLEELTQTFPVLFIKGEKSSYITSEQEQLIFKYFPKAQIEEIKNAGHWVHADQPEQFLQTLQTFLNRI